jgi:deoxyribodipyrimidine photolyase-related protein
MIERILYIGFDQLNANCGVLKSASAKSDVIALIQSEPMTTGKNWHPERLYFLISSARHFAQELREKGFKVEYIKASSTTAGLDQLSKKYRGAEISAAEPSSHRLYKSLSEYGVTFVENDFFLTPRSLFANWADQQKSYLLENFYRKQRVRLNILMDKTKNYNWPKYPTHCPDQIDKEVAKELGHSPSTNWATTRAGALKQLDNFLKNHFANFGPYEDAITDESWALHHSLLSPYLNNGLLHPEEVIKAALKRFEKGDIPIASAEAFIRQIIGWREYVNGMYWYLGSEYRQKNGLRAKRELPQLFGDPRKTKMNCMKNTITDINNRAWVHHIPRLMILSNFALIAGINPQQFLQWMREVFIDASDWVMGSKCNRHGSSCRWWNYDDQTLCSRWGIYFKDEHPLQGLFL